MSELTIRPLRPEETRQFAELSYYAFAGRTPDEREADFGRRAVPERQALVAVEDGQIVSQVLIYDFGIWLAGVRYRSGGLANVATVPERARRGHASAVLRRALAWMRDDLGMTLSILYPTVYPLYRTLGWIQAGHSRRLTGPPSAFRPAAQLPMDPNGRIVRRLAQLTDVDLLEPLYRRFAEPRSGYLDRPRWYWEDYVLRTQRGTQPRWLALWYGADQQLAGYLIYSFQTPASGAPVDPQLEIYELIALRPTAYQALLSFVSSHHLWKKVLLRGGLDVAWETMVDNPHQLDVQAPPGAQPMARILDVPRAIAARPAGGSSGGELLLQVRDEAAPWNGGTWHIRAGRGFWLCEPANGVAADATLDISTLTGLFVGALTPRQAIDNGGLQADRRVLSVLDDLFALPYPPQLNDYF